ncbi:hypothetical protein FM106_24020 [Brachybacterium faecium]|nr:hypothetical protein FM106_24020 [Brachybacterium faecium]
MRDVIFFLQKKSVIINCSIIPLKPLLFKKSSGFSLEIYGIIKNYVKIKELNYPIS